MYKLLLNGINIEVDCVNNVGNKHITQYYKILRSLTCYINSTVTNEF